MSIEHDPTGDGRGSGGARRSPDLAPSPAVQVGPGEQPVQADGSAWAAPGEADPAWEDASGGAGAAWDDAVQPGPSVWDAAPEPGPSVWDAAPEPGPSVWDAAAPAPASTWAEPAAEKRPDDSPAASDQVAVLAERLAAIVGASDGAPDLSGEVDDAASPPQERGRSSARGYGGGRRTGGTRRTGGGRGRAPASEPPASGAAGTDAEPDQESVARSIALRQLTAAPRSRAQLAEAMAKRDVPEEVADRVLDRFTEVGLVDDAAYAEVLVRSRHAERGLSRRALAMELRRKGVDDEIAQEALAQVDDADEEQAARALARKKLRATRGLDREVRLRRAYGALGRKGYGGSLVSRVVREELAAEGLAEDDDWRDAD
jgi:regulatory protein